MDRFRHLTHFSQQQQNPKSTTQLSQRAKSNPPASPMSQTNPRKAVLRNGAASPAVPDQPNTTATTTSSNLPTPPHHPLPQNPHKHRGNPRPYGQRSSPKPPAVDESPEVRELRKKYGDKLFSLKDIYGSWSDEDLLTLLNDCNGNADIAATKIADGESPPFTPTFLCGMV